MSNEEPLLGLSEDSIGMHCDFGEELVEEAEESRVSSCEGLLKEGRSW